MQCTFCTYLHSFTYPFIELLHAKCRACMQFKFLNFCSITATVASTITNMQHCTTMTHAGKLNPMLFAAHSSMPRAVTVKAPFQAAFAAGDLHVSFARTKQSSGDLMDCQGGTTRTDFLRLTLRPGITKVSILLPVGLIGLQNNADIIVGEIAVTTRMGARHPD